MLIVNFQIRVTLDDTHPNGECSQGRVSEPVLCPQGVVGIKEFVVIRNSGKEFNFSNKVTRDKRDMPVSHQKHSLYPCSTAQ